MRSFHTSGERADAHTPNENARTGLDRRNFLKRVAAAAAGVMTAPGAAIARQARRAGPQCNPDGLEVPPRDHGPG